MFLCCTGEELSKKQAAQEATIRKLRAQVQRDAYKCMVFHSFILVASSCNLSYIKFLNLCIFICES